MRLTVGELIEQLRLFDAKDEVSFSGDLDFYRLKKRDESLVQVEFNQNVYRDENGEWKVEP